MAGGRDGRRDGGSEARDAAGACARRRQGGRSVAAATGSGVVLGVAWSRSHCAMTACSPRARREAPRAAGAGDMSVIWRMASTIAEDRLRFTTLLRKMSDPPTTIATVAFRRPQRADARRNFDALLAAAREVFAEQGTDASLEEIARRAGVGIATLYRNFPSRQDLFDAVYRGEVDELCATARGMDELPPWEAFAAWVDRFAGYVATKMAIKEGLDKDSTTLRDCRTALVAACEPLFRRAQAAGAIRADAEFDDVLRMLTGVTAGTYVSDAQREHVLRMALDGIRAR